MKISIQDIPDNIIEAALEKVHTKPKSLEEMCIVLKDGTKINCDTRAFMSDVCPHGVYLCTPDGECKEGCMWMVKGKIAAPLSKSED